MLTVREKPSWLIRHSFSLFFLFWQVFLQCLYNSFAPSWELKGKRDRVRCEDNGQVSWSFTPETCFWCCDVLPNKFLVVVVGGGGVCARLLVWSLQHGFHCSSQGTSTRHMQSSYIASPIGVLRSTGNENVWQIYLCGSLPKMKGHGRRWNQLEMYSTVSWKGQQSRTYYLLLFSALITAEM